MALVDMQGKKKTLFATSNNHPCNYLPISTHLSLWVVIDVDMSDSNMSARAGLCVMYSKRPAHSVQSICHKAHLCVRKISTACLIPWLCTAWTQGLDVFGGFKGTEHAQKSFASHQLSAFRFTFTELCSNPDPLTCASRQDLTKMTNIADFFRTKTRKVNLEAKRHGVEANE